MLLKKTNKFQTSDPIIRPINDIVQSRIVKTSQTKKVLIVLAIIFGSVGIVTLIVIGVMQVTNSFAGRRTADNELNSGDSAKSSYKSSNVTSGSAADAKSSSASQSQSSSSKVVAPDKTSTIRSVDSTSSVPNTTESFRIAAHNLAGTWLSDTPQASYDKAYSLEHADFKAKYSQTEQSAKYGNLSPTNSGISSPGTNDAEGFYHGKQMIAALYTVTTYTDHRVTENGNTHYDITSTSQYVEIYVINDNGVLYVWDVKVSTSPIVASIPS